jgi:HEPN domain-containing protein
MSHYHDWIKKSESDLTSSKVLLSNNPPILDTAVYHAQQCVEKALKAYLIFKTGSHQRKHDLTFLLGECNIIDTDFSNFSDEADSLAPYVTAYRYPGLSSDFEPDYEEAKEAIEYANKILDFVKRKIGI